MKPSRSFSARNRTNSASADLRPAVQRRHPPLHPEVEQQPLEPGRVHHPRAHVGGNALPGAGAEQEEARADLAQIGHHRLLLLDEVDDHPGDQRLGHGVDLLHDPRQRQHRDVVVAGAPRVAAEVGEAVAEEGSRLQHGELGLGGGARGGAEHGDVAAGAGGHLALVEAGVVPLRLLAQRVQGVEADDPRIAVLAHPAGVAIDDLQHAGRLLDELEQLVHLLLVLGEDQPRLGVIEQVAHLLAHGVLVDAERGAAERVRRDLAPDPLRPVVADQRDAVSPRQPQPLHAERHQPDPALVLGPGERVPDAELLLAHRDRVGAELGVVGQHLGEGVVDDDVGVGAPLAHCAAAGRGASVAGAPPWGGSASASAPR